MSLRFSNCEVQLDLRNTAVKGKIKFLKCKKQNLTNEEILNNQHTFQTTSKINNTHQISLLKKKEAKICYEKLESSKDRKSELIFFTVIWIKGFSAPEIFKNANSNMAKARRTISQWNVTPFK